ncbi:MAG: hypothetical protein ACLGHM_02070 [Actinomycetes bacterium]
MSSASEATEKGAAVTGSPGAGAIGLAAGIGLVSAVVGLAPWLVTGERLPLQNLWAAPTLPDDMPFALLPLNQYFVAAIAAMLIVGGGVAGTVMRVRAARGRALPVWPAVVGLLVVQLGSLAQSAAVLRPGLRADAGVSAYAQAYLVAMVLGTVLCSALAVVVLLMIARAGVAGAAVAWGVASIALGSWLSALLKSEPAFGTAVSGSVLSHFYQWLPVVGAAAAAAWSGFVTARRAVATLVILVMLWVLPALVTAMSYVLTPMYTTYPEDMLLAGLDVLRMALGPDGGAPRRLVVAVTVALAVAAWRLIARRRDRDPGIVPTRVDDPV